MISEYTWQGKRRLYLFCGIKGLIRDGDSLKEELLRIRPGRIYVCISQEEIEGLGKFLEDPFEINMSDFEILYGVALSRYGEVMTPPPIYIEPVQYSKQFNTQLTGLDFPEDEFSQMYSDTIRPRDLVAHSMRKKSIGRKRFPQQTPEEFVIEWDALITRNPRMRRIEELRLHRMFDTFMQEFRASESEDSVLVMEYEKCAALKEMLVSAGFTPSVASIP